MKAAAAQSHHSRFSIRRKFARGSLRCAIPPCLILFDLRCCNVHRAIAAVSCASEGFANLRMQLSGRSSFEDDLARRYPSGPPFMGRTKELKLLILKALSCSEESKPKAACRFPAPSRSTSLELEHAPHGSPF